MVTAWVRLLMVRRFPGPVFWGHIHRRQVRDLWFVISVMTTFSSGFSPRLDQIIMINKSAVSLVQPPEIQPIGWNRYLDQKETSRWFSEDLYVFISWITLLYSYCCCTMHGPVCTFCTGTCIFVLIGWVLLLQIVHEYRNFSVRNPGSIDRDHLIVIITSLWIRPLVSFYADVMLPFLWYVLIYIHVRYGAGYA